MGRLWAIPDIHGEFDLLEQLWKKLIDEEALDLSVDKVVFLGDMIDRGPKSKQVIEFVRNLTLLQPQNVIALAGNHEWLAIDAHIKSDYSNKHLWYINGGDNTLISYRDPQDPGRPVLSMPDEDIKWLAFLPLQHQEPGFFFSHAPVPRESFRNILYRGTTEFQPEELIWTYSPDERGIARDHGDGIIGVSGHIHQLRKGVMSPRFYDNHYYLDAGCGCSSKAPLVAVEVKTKKVVYVFKRT
jgi:Calcineurin-like phosphoesterase